MKRRILIFVALLGLFILSSTGCQEVTNDQTGRIIVKITDEPFPIDLIEEASVTIIRVEIRSDEEVGNEDENEVVEEGEVDEKGEGDEGEKEDKENTFLTIFEGSEEFNLVDLRNGMMAELLNLEVPVGNYNLIRIYVDDASISVKDYETYSVKVPSGSQTGIKMFIKPSLKVASGLTAEVLLDFSLNKSFVLKGNMKTPAGIKGFNFKPVIRAVNNTTAGVVYGVVRNVDNAPIADVAVSIAQEEVISTAFTDEDGFYALPGIPAGTFSMSAEKEGYNPVSVEEVDVVEGNKTVQDFMLELITSG